MKKPGEICLIHKKVPKFLQTYAVRVIIIAFLATAMLIPLIPPGFGVYNAQIHKLLCTIILNAQ